MRSLTDAQAIALFLDMLSVEKGAANNSILAYAQDLRQASKWLSLVEREAPVAITREDGLVNATKENIRSILAKYEQEEISRQSQGRKLSSLRQFYLFLNRESYRADTPMEDIVSPGQNRKLPRALTTNQVDRLFATMQARQKSDPGPRNIRLAAMLELLYGSGLRASEVVSLLRHSVRAETPFITLTGKGNKQRLVPIHSRALQAILDWSQYVPNNERFLFPSNGKSGHLTRVRLFQLIRHLAIEAGLPKELASPHILRHSFASHLLENNADLLFLKQVLGHSDITTTQIYTHIAQSHLTEALNRHHPLSRKNDP